MRKEWSVRTQRARGDGPSSLPTTIGTCHGRVQTEMPFLEAKQWAPELARRIFRCTAPAKNFHQSRFTGANGE
jgi:hypothetical protein